MLLIAIPKSASSSLLATLDKLHPEIGTVQDFSFRHNKIPERSKQIHRVHSDIRELSSKELEKFQDPEVIYKQHIFPSENNIQLLQDTKKVILLRKPEEILHAYKRGARKNHNSLPPGYSDKMKGKDLLRKSKEDGFLADLHFFYNHWYKTQKDPNTLIIQYLEYLDHPKKIINKIEGFLGLSLTEINVIPVKARYSKLSAADHLKTIRKKGILILKSAVSHLGLKSGIKNLKDRFG
ncbi:sulfotransferase domain-containing protein [Christiangramia echinicola]|uniref:Sulfotransferase domain-containing protein n=1 Tax=Christiangramia echinicola TaxID=279359 RepID=A0A1H1L440_9FLAO|nr:sulfotransferase domain-containing protein [Christiangramia echinicola]SDR69328.1 Sulfotransferase domain-containing protein [Christiangramia echinicola]